MKDWKSSTYMGKDSGFWLKINYKNPYDKYKLAKQFKMFC